MMDGLRPVGRRPDARPAAPIYAPVPCGRRRLWTGHLAGVVTQSKGA